MSDVVVHQRAHLLEVDFDGQRVFADQERLHGFDTGPGDGPGGSRFSVAGKAAVGVDPDEAVPCYVVQAHGLDIGDFHLAGVGFGKELQVGEKGSRGQGDGETHEIAAGPDSWVLGHGAVVPRDKCAPSQRKPLAQVFLTFRAQLKLVFPSGSTVDVIPFLDEMGNILVFSFKYLNYLMVSS